MTIKLVKTIAPWLAAGMLLVAATGCETGVEEEGIGEEGIEGVEEERLGEEEELGEEGLGEEE